jgi:Domain of unknown function (DUF1844)
VLMAEERPSLQIDDDWKKQAQEEKRRLAEREQKAAPAPAQAAPPGAGAALAGAEPGAPAGAAPGSAARGRAPAGRRGREMPAANFNTLLNSIVTQALLYLGELAPAGSEPMLNLDMAKHQVDMLNVLEEKTRNNLTEEEQHALDSALYETRMRYVNTASQYM